MQRSVTFVNRYFHPDQSATSQLLSDLAFALAARGWKVEVLTSRQLYEEPLAALAAEETLRGVRVHRLGTTSFGRLRLAGRFADYLSFHAKVYWWLRTRDSSGVVVAMTDPPLISTTAALAIKRPQKRLVIWTQDVFPEIAEVELIRGKRMLGRALRWLRDLGARRSALSVAVGERMREEIERYAARVEVLPNWALEESAGANGEGFRRDHAIRESSFVVGYSGNFGRVHEFDSILVALAELRDADVHFLLTGGGGQFFRVEELVAWEKLQNVTLLPYQPRQRLGELLAASDMHLVSLAAGYEGLVVPSKFYGIAAAGRATVYVGNRDGDVARLIEQFDCGVVVEPGSGDELARVIRGLSKDRELVRTLGENARRAWRGCWRKEMAVDRWEEVLKVKSEALPGF
ncbi:MAG TPA: glycosyltransferase family 4 protein [Thermoanaerobaculia bacterium]|nr:glycosyltransferase family 4 protein [Thermoanaerobaculia bacterium]